MVTIFYLKDRMNKKEFGKWVRTELVSLGPVFVKLGQLLSTRGDWLNEEVRDELAKLQDKVDDYSFIKFNHPNVSAYNTTPIACASFGQVHDVLWNDTPAVVKLQKPYVRTSLAADMWGLAILLHKLDKLGVSSAKHMLDIVRDYRRSLWKELNYKNEENNLMLLQESLNNLKWNIVPKVYYSSRTEIVMEKIPGIKITNIEELKVNNIDTKKVINALLKSFFYQVLIGGAFHADPHPGNVAVKKNGIIWYDGGNVCITGDAWRQELLVLTRSVLKRDVNEIMNNLLNMKIIKSDKKSKDAIEAFVKATLKLLEDKKINKNWKQQLQELMMKDPQYSKDLRNAIISESSYIMLGRALTLVEGICETLDPNIDIVQTSIPIIQDIWTSYVPFSEYSFLIKEMLN